MPSDPIREFLDIDVFMGNAPAAQHAGVASRYFLPFYGGCFGLGYALYSNYARLKPVYAGIQKHIFCVIAGIAAGEAIYHLKEWKYARRDARLKHFIELHADKFVNDERPKYKDVFEEWVPVR